MKFNNIIIQKEKRFKEYIFGKNGIYMGKIVQDNDGNYYLQPNIFGTKYKLGRGKCLKEAAERLIELNYKNNKNKEKEKK